MITTETAFAPPSAPQSLEETGLSADLVLQIVTKTLHLVAGLYTRLGFTMGHDPDLKEMLQPLDPRKMELEVTEQIEDAIPRLRFGSKREAAHET